MTGFFGRLFGRNGDNQAVGDYFLDQDSAKTYGDVEFMRKRKKIVRTFPKIGDAEEGAEVIREVSSVEEREIEENETPKVVFDKPSFTPKKDTPSQPNANSTDMDFFRKLAKDVRRS
jgi:hypothetical protein